MQVWAIVAAFSHARTCSLTQMPPHADAQLDFIALQAALIHTAALSYLFFAYAFWLAWMPWRASTATRRA